MRSGKLSPSTGSISNPYVSTRVKRWMPLVDARLQALYGTTTDIDKLRERLLSEVLTAAGQRKPPLLALDAEREVDPTWFQQSSMVGYVAYADRFTGTLNGVLDRLDYLDELGVRYLHLMKTIRARDGANDGGYAVVDYLAVDPALGTWAEFENLAAKLHERGISICVDVVMNHTAGEHEWALKAKAGSQTHRAYYLTYPDRAEPDRFERSLPEVFPEMAPGNFTWDDDLQAWVWTTFNSYQWDLNYANPDVLVEMLKVMLGLANAGADVLRLDAVAFTWKRLGTNCQNQPEAHLIAQIYRALLAIAAPATVLKAEAIVAPDDLLPYLGAHRLRQPECQIAYHNQLMVMLWSALASGDASLATQALDSLPATPVEATWVNYVRCHDDIGWAVSDSDAAAVGLDGAAHRRYLAEFYRGDFPGSYAEGVPFSSNEHSGDERTCGMTSALSGLLGAQRRGDQPAIDAALQRIELLYGVAFGFAGIPLIYMGDEIGLGNDDSYLADPDLADDSRWMHRPPMAWDLAEQRQQPGTVAHRLFTWISQLSKVRSQLPAMSAGGETYIHRLTQPEVLAWHRRHAYHGAFYGLANFSDRSVTLPHQVLNWAALELPRPALSSDGVAVTTTAVTLPARAVAWFTDDADATLGV